MLRENGGIIAGAEESERVENMSSGWGWRPDEAIGLEGEEEVGIVVTGYGVSSRLWLRVVGTSRNEEPERNLGLIKVASRVGSERMKI